jgi:hypothetical protein
LIYVGTIFVDDAAKDLADTAAIIEDSGGGAER